MTGTIFDIKEFSIHDGPGSRFTVFLKGCPLRCKWCHNPEGLTAEKQLTVKVNLCTHCGKCLSGCNHPECEPFGRCVHTCPRGCVSIVGIDVSSDELADKLLEYKDFFEMTGGGVTVSGGEPLMQSDFVCELADKLGGIHKAIQTSGYADSEVYRRTIDKFDYIMQDIKLADDLEHRKYTGVSNARILKNIEYLKKSGKSFVLRVPLIPNITDTPQNLSQISEIAEESRVELLSYNPMSGAKYEMLGYDFPLNAENSDEKNTEENFTRYFRNAVIL